MLSELTVQHFTIVDELHLSFDNGMTVVTGETGAGKSVLLSALGLALGDRADANLVRHDAQKADIVVIFNDISDKTQHWLRQQDYLNADDESIILIRRTINKDGRSRAYLNGLPCTLAELKTMGELLIDIHSQHANQSLLRKTTQRALLDDYAKTQTLVQTVRKHFLTWQNAQKALKEAQTLAQHTQARMELLRYQVQELEQLDPQEQECQQLEDLQKTLAHADHIKATAMAIIEASETEQSPIHIFNQGLNALAKLPYKNDAMVEAESLLNSAKIQYEEALSELTRGADHIDTDPERLYEVEQRLTELYEMARKHKCEAHELTNIYQQLNAELHSLNTNEQQMEQLKNDLTPLKQTFITSARLLSKKRHAKCKTLAKEATRLIRTLGMPQAEFEIRIKTLDEQNATLYGLDDVEFYVMTNPGQGANPLNKVVSGGELSRVSLVLQVLTAQSLRIPTLIFDEVDVGIGGQVAEVVGRLLRTLGESGQVVCITHQPQVAAQGQHHLNVAKHTHNKQTYTHIKPLDESARVDEIARMIGGLTSIEQSKSHAKEMLKAGQNG